ncbi:hypothetical protein ACVNIS_08565 [Sphaerotilaceae bacterium SBD11-9]
MNEIHSVDQHADLHLQQRQGMNSGVDFAADYKAAMEMQRT